MVQASDPGALMTVAPAVIGAVAAIVVLILTDVLTRMRENKTRRQEAALKFRERQIGDFYGPLLSLIEQIQSVYAIKEDLLKADERLTPGDPRRLTQEQKNRVDHYFWLTHFDPLHQAVRELFRTRFYLLEGGTTPASFGTYLRHSVQEKAQKEIANNLGIDTSFLRGVTYPRDFDTNVKAALDKLMATYGPEIARLKA
jgi:hypothetical protein